MNKPKQDITLDRQSSSVSTMSSSWADVGSISSTEDIASFASVQNFVIGLAVFGLGFYCTEYFVPAHDHALDRPHPYQTIASGDLILDFQLNHPLIYPASVPAKLLKRSCVFAPLLLLVLIHSRSSWNCALASISAHLSGMGICEVCTHILKHYVLRRRPNFYALCEWEGDGCTASAKKILESQLSFPSGHSSLSWCGMTFLVLILLGKITQLSRRWRQGTCWKQWLVWMACLIPWGWSAYVSSSRIVDKWHHPSDVIAGTFIESLVQQYPITRSFLISCLGMLEFPLQSSQH